MFIGSLNNHRQLYQLTLLQSARIFVYLRYKLWARGTERQLGLTSLHYNWNIEGSDAQGKQLVISLYTRTLPIHGWNYPVSNEPQWFSIVCIWILNQSST